MTSDGVADCNQMPLRREKGSLFDHWQLRVVANVALVEAVSTGRPFVVSETVETMDGVQPFALLSNTLGLTGFERLFMTRELTGRSSPFDTTPAEDVLVPAFESDERQLSSLATILTLVATTIGGGVFGLPTVFAKVGILYATVLLATVAVLVDRSMYLWCLCARRAGVDSLGEVGRVAFGDWMKTTILSMVFGVLLALLTGYLVILRNVWGPLASVLYPKVDTRWVLALIVVIVYPFLVQRQLHSLRFGCFVGLLSMVGFCAIMCYLSGDVLVSLLQQPRAILQTPPRNLAARNTHDFADEALSVIPLAIMAFLFPFNMLGAQATLQQPTKHRVRSVIRSSVMVCWFLSYLVGLTGYLYGLDCVEWTVIDPTNRLLVLGYIGYGLTLLLALPLLVLPCRTSILEIADKFLTDHNENCQPLRDICPEDCCDEEDPDERTCMSFPSLSSWSTERSPGDLLVIHEGTRLLPRIEEEAPPRCKIFLNPWAHYGSTFSIVAIAFGAALLCRDALRLWMLVGSTLALVVTFFLPGACFVQIQERDLNYPYRRPWALFSWLLMTLSIVGMLACTYATIRSLVQS